MKREEIHERLRKLPYYGKLEFVYMYGSAASGRITERSDIDICLHYDITDKKKLHRLLFKISGSFPDKYDISIFNLLPLYVRREVFRGNLIYTKDKGKVYDIAYRTSLDFNDFEPMYKYILHGKAGVGKVSI